MKGPTPQLWLRSGGNRGDRPARSVRVTWRRVRALLIPADPQRPITLIDVEDSATAFSDAIDGGLLDDTITGRLGRRLGGSRYVMYLDERTRDVSGAGALPDNRRATVLAARLGHIDRDLLRRLRGDVPASVLALAHNVELVPILLDGVRDPAQP